MSSYPLSRSTLSSSAFSFNFCLRKRSKLVVKPHPEGPKEGPTDFVWEAAISSSALARAWLCSSCKRSEEGSKEREFQVQQIGKF